MEKLEKISKAEVQSLERDNQALQSPKNVPKVPNNTRIQSSEESIEEKDHILPPIQHIAAQKSVKSVSNFSTRSKQRMVQKLSKWGQIIGCCRNLCGKKRSFRERQSVPFVQNREQIPRNQSFSFVARPPAVTQDEDKREAQSVMLEPIPEVHEFKEPFAPKRQKVSENRNFATISPKKNETVYIEESTPANQNILQLNSIIEKQSEQIEQLKQMANQASQKSQNNNSFRNDTKRSQKSNTQQNPYRSLINKLNKQKTMLDTYYSGPPKYEINETQKFIGINGNSLTAKFEESQNLLHLISDSGNTSGVQGMFKGKIDTQDRIDITKGISQQVLQQNPEQSETKGQKISSQNNTDLGSRTNSPKQNEVFFKPVTTNGNSIFKLPVQQITNDPTVTAIKSNINLENEKILEQQKKISEFVEEKIKKQSEDVQQILNTEIAKQKKAANNQNYTIVPDNSQISPQSESKEITCWDGKITEQPDEDTRDELNLPEINIGVFKSIFDQNQAMLNQMQLCEPSFISALGFRMRSLFGFLKLELRVFGQNDIESSASWQKFIENESAKISSGTYQAVIILLGKNSDQIDFVIITEEKMCEICFTNNESVIQWSESSGNDQGGDLNSKLLDIHSMLNGKRFAEEKKLFGPTIVTPDTIKAMQEFNEKLSITAPERPKETIITQKPLFAVFAYYKYYLLQEKYKGIVKFNMDHKAYFAKRDTLMELVNKNELENYWRAAILSFVCV